MAEIYITAQRLIETLNIDSQELIDVENFIDSALNTEWTLVLGKDYKVVNGQGLREYTSSGAIVIAECLKAKAKTKTKGNWFKKQVKELISAVKRNLQKTHVQERIVNNSSSLLQNNSYYFLSKADVVAIFRTRSEHLTKMSRQASRNEATLLVQGDDYLDIPDKGVYYSLSGMMKLAKVFAQEMGSKDRREWCTEVGDTITPYMQSILNQIQDRDKAIDKAVDRAKQNVLSRCQVTGVKGNKIKKIPMTGHHLYSRAEYPHLVDSVDNIICIASTVHDHFHQFMGGTKVSCTVDDFIRFVQLYYPENELVCIWLTQQKLRLGNQQPISKRDHHVLHLSWPIPRLLNPDQ
jgi:hypothetical protein